MFSVQFLNPSFRVFHGVEQANRPPEQQMPSLDLNNVPPEQMKKISVDAGHTLKTGGEVYGKALEQRLKSDPRFQEALANLMSQYGKQPPEFGTMSRNDQKKFLEGASTMLSGPGGSFFKGTSGNIDFGLLAVNTTVTDTIQPTFIRRPVTAPIQPQRPVINSIHGGIAVNGGINRVGPGGFQRGAYASGSGARNEAGTIGGD